MHRPQGVHEPSEMLCRMFDCGGRGEVGFCALFIREEPWLSKDFQVVLFLMVLRVLVLIQWGYKVGFTNKPSHKYLLGFFSPHKVYLNRTRIEFQI